MDKYKIAVIIPVYNAKTTLIQTFDSLLGQTLLPDELIIVNDASTDESPSLIDGFLRINDIVFQNKGVEVKLIQHDKAQGLSASYNDGIIKSSGDLVVTLHSDIILKPTSLEQLIAPFSNPNSSEIVATYHLVDHPYEIWQKYNFWQKCFFSRLVGKKFYGLDGKFDCFRKAAVEKVGYFDARRFKNAGEDGDMVYKLKKLGKIVKTDAEILHIHSMDPKFSYKNIILKQKQYSESQGILLRLGRLTNPQNLPVIFFREFLVFALLIPCINLISLMLIIIYSFYYTKLAFIKEYKDGRIFLLPFLNIYLLFVSTFYSIKGFLYGKQHY